MLEFLTPIIGADKTTSPNAPKPLFTVSATVNAGGQVPRIRGTVSVNGPEVVQEFAAARELWKNELTAKILERLRSSEHIVSMHAAEEALNILRANRAETQAAIDKLDSEKAAALSAPGAMQARYRLESERQLLAGALIDLEPSLKAHGGVQHKAYREFVAAGFETMRAVYTEAREAAMAKVAAERGNLEDLIRANLAPFCDAIVQLAALECPDLLPALNGLAPTLLPAMAEPHRLHQMELAMLQDKVARLRLGQPDDLV